MFRIFQWVLQLFQRIIGNKHTTSTQSNDYKEFNAGSRKIRYRLIREQAVYQRAERDQLNAVIVLPDFEPAQHEDILMSSLKELGQELNIDTFSVYQNDEALSFGSQSNDLTEDEQRSFRESFIGVYPGRRR